MNQSYDLPRKAQNLGDLDVLVIGGANSDFLIKGPSLPGPGVTVEGEALLEGPGGKGANQAVAAARLGARVAFIGRVGADERGRALRAALDKEGVETSALALDPEARTGAALIMVDAKGEKQILTAPGANRLLTPDHVAAQRSLLARARVVLLQLELPMETVAAAVHLGHAAGARVVLDPAPARPLSDDLLRDVDVIRPNASEAETLTGIAITGRETARRAGQDLLRRGAGAVIVGAPEGALVVSPDRELWLAHLPVAAVDATGAGDAFSAALAVSISRGETLEDAARSANAAAALATTRVGAQAGLPTRAELQRLLAIVHRD